jgi:GAF domain-containing protein
MTTEPSGRISEERAALRRIATLVGRAGPPEQVLAAVAAEAGRLIEADFAVLSRYDPDDTATVIGTWARTGSPHPLAGGTRLEQEELSVHTLVFRTRQPARIDDYGDASGQGAAMAHARGVRSIVGVPVSLEGRLWGVIGVASRHEQPLPADTEAWLAGFTELVAAAIANTQAQIELRTYAAEQAALRRVATLVGQATSPEQVFGAVTAELGRLLSVDLTVMGRYEPDGVATIMGTWSSTGLAVPTPGNGRVELGGQNVTTRVFETGRPARLDSYAHTSGAAADFGRGWGLRSMVGAPISVEGRLWGIVIVAYTHEEPLPGDTEARLAGFTELVATAIANTQARAELRGYAEEQAALRRVATLVARATSPEHVFAAVTAEAGRLLEVDLTFLSRYDADVVAPVGAWASTGDSTRTLVGSRIKLGGQNVNTLVFETSRPARIDRPEASGAAADVFREWGIRSCVGAPISVDGQLWGVLGVAYTHDEPLPAGTEGRLAGFTELVATAIADAQARVELRGFAEEQAALRRVATLVARAAPAEEVFAAVAEEVGLLLDVDFTVLSRYETDGAVEVVGGWAKRNPGRPPAVGVRLEPGGWNMHTRVFQTGRPARIEDFGAASGAAADVARDWGFRSAIGAPINVEDRLWGVISAASRGDEPLPAGSVARLAGFTELVGTALANAEAQSALKVSRARIVAAADAARRRIERDLHDGAQQRLVTLALQVRSAQAAVPPAAEELVDQLESVTTELTSVLDELREMARGIHPTVLTQGGLRPAMTALARRSAVPVALDVRVQGRLPEPVEVATYYVVAEALTNAAKHARASVVEVVVEAADGVLQVCVRDDGHGGAHLAGGSGLVGLKDRVEALGGPDRPTECPGCGHLRGSCTPAPRPQQAATASLSHLPLGSR